jgi:hypothetical protein
MVLLTMTASMVEALKRLQSSANISDMSQYNEAEVQLSKPEIGKPISHGQVLDISVKLKELRIPSYRLDVLLQGSRVYNPPPLPKPEPVRLV